MKIATFNVNGVNGRFGRNSVRQVSPRDARPGLRRHAPSLSLVARQCRRVVDQRSCSILFATPKSSMHGTYFLDE